MQSQKRQNDLCSCPRHPFNITVIQVYALITNAKEAEVEWFYDDLQDRLELTPKKKAVLFIIGDCNAKVGSQELLGVMDKLGLGVQNEAGQRLIEFCQENTLVIGNTHFQQHKRRLYTWTSPDGQHQNQSLSHVQLFATSWTATHQASCPARTPRVYSKSCPLSQ